MFRRSTGSQAHEYHELDDERVLVLVHWSGRGKTSGVELAQMQAKGAHMFQLREGKVTRLVVYFDRERALAELGISEQDAHADSAREPAGYCASLWGAKTRSCPETGRFAAGSS